MRNWGRHRQTAAVSGPEASIRAPRRAPTVRLNSATVLNTEKTEAQGWSSSQQGCRAFCYDVVQELQVPRPADGTCAPVDQARDGKYAVRRYVEGDARWGTRSRIRWAHVVVLPYTKLDEDFAVPDCPRSLVADRTQQGNLVTVLRAAIDHQETQCRRAEPADVATIAQILAWRGLPQLDLLAVAAEREDHSSASPNSSR